MALARLSFSPLKCVDHLDRVLAGCCWEVHATRVTPPESLPSLHQVAKCLTMQLAVYLAKEVAAILRAVLTHDTKKLYNEGTVHLLCSNYGYNQSTRSCSTHRPDTMRPGKEKESDPAVAWPVLKHTLGRPRNGSHQLLAPAFMTGSVVFAMRTPCRYGFRPTGPSDTPTVTTEGGSYRAENPSWMDQEEGSGGYSQAMAGGKGKQTYAVQGWQLSRWWLLFVLVHTFRLCSPLHLRLPFSFFYFSSLVSPCPSAPDLLLLRLLSSLPHFLPSVASLGILSSSPLLAAQIYLFLSYPSPLLLPLSLFYPTSSLLLFKVTQSGPCA